MTAKEKKEIKAKIEENTQKIHELQLENMKLRAVLRNAEK